MRLGASILVFRHGLANGLSAGVNRAILASFITKTRSVCQAIAQIGERIGPYLKWENGLLQPGTS